MLQENNLYPLVSVITVNYNGAALTAELLRSIGRNSYPRLEVIVVDNASAEDPAALLQEALPAVRIIRSADNRGFAGGNNLGIRAATGDYLFLVNNDTEFTDGLVEGLLEIFRQYPDAGMASPKFHYYFQPGTIEYAGYHKMSLLTARQRKVGSREKDSGQHDRISATHYAHGAAMMVPAKVLKEVGLMPELYFLYYEELDWCEQFKRKGYRIYYQYRSLIYHKESMTTGRNSPLKTYYLTRNRILFMRRNTSGWRRACFMGYLACCVVPVHTLRLALQKQRAHLGAFWKAIGWHLAHYNLEDKIYKAEI